MSEFTRMDTMIHRMSEISARRSAAKFQWLQWMITLSAGMGTILVALHTGGPHSRAESWSFFWTVVLLATGIFFGCIARHGEVSLQTALMMDTYKQMQNDIRDHRPIGSTPALGDIPWMYKAAAGITYFALTGALIALVFNAYQISVGA